MTSVFGAQVFPLLDKAGIPAIGDSMFSLADFTDPGSYPLAAGANIQFRASPLIAKEAGKKSIASLAFDIGSAIVNADEVKKGAAKLGMDYKGIVKIPLQATDYAPYMQQLKNLKPDAVVMIVSAASAPTIWKAAQQLGLKTTWVAYPDVASDQVIKAAGNLAEGMLLTSPYPVPSDPKFAQYNKELDAAKAAGIKNTERREGIEPVHPWAAVHAIAAMAEKMSGEFNAQTLTEALKAQTTPINVGGLVDWNPSLKGPSDFPRVGNGNMYFQIVKNGKLVPYGSGQTDVYQALGMK
jgi:ABC-type branched-subunit amino acid transport system substrate-binding protein